MVQEQFTGRKTANQQAFGNDRYRINLQVLADDYEGGLHLENSQGSVVKSASFSIYHLSFIIWHLLLRLFVYVRVISWIVLHLSARETIHEVTRNDPIDGK